MYGEQSKRKLSGKGQDKLQLSEHGNECKPLSLGITSVGDFGDIAQLAGSATAGGAERVWKAGAYSRSLFSLTRAMFMG